MNEPIGINPSGLRRAASDFDELVDKTKQLLSALEANTNSKGAAWGDDDIGHKFADGDKGYIKNRDNTFGSLTNVAEVFEQNAANLRDTAAKFENAEQQGTAENTVRNSGVQQAGPAGNRDVQAELEQSVRNRVVQQAVPEQTNRDVSVAQPGGPAETNRDLRPLRQGIPAETNPDVQAVPAEANHHAQGVPEKSVHNRGVWQAAREKANRNVQGAPQPTLVEANRDVRVVPQKSVHNRGIQQAVPAEPEHTVRQETPEKTKRGVPRTESAEVHRGVDQATPEQANRGAAGGAGE